MFCSEDTFAFRSAPPLVGRAIFGRTFSATIHVFRVFALFSRLKRRQRRRRRRLLALSTLRM